MWLVEYEPYFYGLICRLIDVGELDRLLPGIEMSAVEYPVYPMRVEHLGYVRKSFEKSAVPYAAEISVQKEAGQPHVFRDVYPVNGRIYLYAPYRKFAFELYRN